MEKLHRDTNTWLAGLVDVTTANLDGTGGYVWCLNEMAASMTPRGRHDERVNQYTSTPHPTYQEAMEAGIRYCYAARMDLLRAASKEAQEAEIYQRKQKRQ
jgi:hypothetical protein